jgi:hypothetical protein
MLIAVKWDARDRSGACVAVGVGAATRNPLEGSLWLNGKPVTTISRATIPMTVTPAARTRTRVLTVDAETERMGGG